MALGKPVLFVARFRLDGVEASTQISSSLVSRSNSVVGSRGIMRRLLDWERDAITEAMGAGEKRESIAAEFGCSRSYPSILARRRGIEPRSAGRPATKRLQLDKTVVAT